MQILEFLDHLDGVRTTLNGWIARCPSHDDRRPSLSVAEGDDGRILINCFAGCTTDVVLESLGLDLRDLFPIQR